jgi:hypothetical protein
LDTHQKTILSDDWGVGMASLIATTAYQPPAIANTGEWLRHSQVFAKAMRQPRKRGPAKTPDFVFEDTSGRFHFVEAKGTQGTLDHLASQMVNGRDQKNNIKVFDPNRVGTRLIVGTRVPLEGSGRLVVVVDDPPIESGFSGSVERARVWLRRVGLAGACRAAGLPTWATALLSEEGFRGDRAGDAARELAVSADAMRSSEVLTGREVDLILPAPLERRGREWRIALGIPTDFLMALLDVSDLDAELLERMAAPEFVGHPELREGSELPPSDMSPREGSALRDDLPRQPEPVRRPPEAPSLTLPPGLDEGGGSITASTPNMLHLRIQRL